MCNSAQKLPERRVATPSVSDLINIWEVTELQLASLGHVMDAPDQGDQQSAELLELQEEEIQTQQNATVQILLETPSRSLHDLAAKLKIWKDTVLPVGAEETICTPVERLAVAAINELLAYLEEEA